MLKTGSFKTLPLEIWYPIKIDNDSKNFYIAYLFQLTAGSTLGFVHIGSDILFISCLLQMCNNYKILNLRFKKFYEYFKSQLNDSIVTDEIKLFSKYVKQHQLLYE